MVCVAIPIFVKKCKSEVQVGVVSADMIKKHRKSAPAGTRFEVYRYSRIRDRCQRTRNFRERESDFWQ